MLEKPLTRITNFFASDLFMNCLMLIAITSLAWWIWPKTSIDTDGRFWLNHGYSANINSNELLLACAPAEFSLSVDGQEIRSLLMEQTLGVRGNRFCVPAGYMEGEIKILKGDSAEIMLYDKTVEITIKPNFLSTLTALIVIIAMLALIGFNQFGGKIKFLIKKGKK